MGGAFAVVWERFVSAQRHQLDAALLDVARREAAEAAAGQLEFTDAPGPSANAVGPLPKYGVLYSVDGATLASTDNMTALPPMPWSQPFDQGFDFEHESLPMRGVVVGVGNTGRRILLATPRVDFEDDAEILARAMATVFVVGCLWAAVVAFAVASRLTREHRVVADVARRVASGDTSARVAFRSADSDLRQLASDLNAMIERLVGLLAVQERFIAHAAHELRTPLTSLRIELELALRTGRERSDYEAALRGSLESARRLTDLADDLLELARLKAAPTEEQTPLEDALTDAIADVAPLGKTRDVAIVAEPLATTVRGDRRGVARIFRNLLENAIRFSPAGATVRVDGSLEGDRVLVKVIDAGPGISALDAERIFEPFARGHGPGGHGPDGGEGTGLGLAIARGLARTFGGDVSVERGQGGRFVIELRRASPRSAS
ncbi:MAG TPA: HAMP domain-containing sensor histidine kinase, partial [Labilithrix sp.]|nr:HAMP domain-containing sensor histidine kinase [Labilithrix sp.]